MTLIIIGAAVFAAGIWVGLGAPGIPARRNRVVTSGWGPRLKPNHIHWLKPRR